jgi:hypothetical protein
MRYARDQDGNRKFAVSEFLTAKQVQSYFSRRVAKLKNMDLGPVDNEAVTSAEDNMLTIKFIQ